MKNEIIERFAEVQQISYEEAEQLIGGETDDYILKNIAKFTTEKIYSQMPPLNRAQRRKLVKKVGKKNVNVVANTAEKINYINLIQELRKLNEKKETDDNEGHGSTQD